MTPSQSENPKPILARDTIFTEYVKNQKELSIPATATFAVNLCGNGTSQSPSKSAQLKFIPSGQRPTKFTNTDCKQ